MNADDGRYYLETIDEHGGRTPVGDNNGYTSMLAVNAAWRELWHEGLGNFRILLSVGYTRKKLRRGPKSKAQAAAL